MTRWRICLLALPLAAAVAAPTGALAASGRGSYRLDRPAGAVPAAHARWDVSGSFLAARAEAGVVGVQVLPQLVDTDSRYLAAKLVEADRAPVTTDCGDGTGHVSTVAISGVTGAPSAFEADLVLDLLHGRGSAQVNVAEAVYAGAEGTYFAPGLARWSYTSTCYDPPEVQEADVPVLGSQGEWIFSDTIGRAAASVIWRLARTGSGPWRLSGRRTVTDGLERDTITAAITFSGSPASMHARCTMPTVRDLRGARTVTQARAVAARAGFDHVSVGTKRTRAARRGRFYLAEGIGNTNPIPCGYRGLHLLRSLGWS
jgi:hypothetical protein